MNTLYLMGGSGIVGAIVGHYWGSAIWPWLKAKIAAQWGKIP